MQELLTAVRARLAAIEYVLGWLHWYRSMASAGELSAQEADAAADSLLPLFAAFPLSGDPPRPLPQLPEALLPTLVNRTALIVTAGDIPVDARIGLWRRVVAVTGADRSEYAGRLAYLGLLLQERSASASDLPEAIGLVRRALDLAGAEDAARSMYLASLVSMLTAMSDRTGLPGALDEAVLTGRWAVAMMNDEDPVRGAVLAILGTALLKQAARDGSLATINELVRVSREALRCAPPERGPSLSLLGGALQARFERTDNLADLDEAISTHREAVACTPAEDPGRPEALANLSMCLRVRFARTGLVDALSEAVTTGYQAVSAAAAAASPIQGEASMSLGLALLARFDRLGSHSDLTEAVRCTRIAADLAEGAVAVHPTRLSNLSVALQTLAKQAGPPEALTEAVSAARHALDLTPAIDISRPGRESNLAIALKDVFESTGAREALDEAIALGNSVLLGVPADHPARCFFLSNAASAHWLRFQHGGTLADLDEAIRLGREAVRTAPPDNPDRSIYLSNLGGALQTRADRTTSTSDIEAALSAHREALDNTPRDHPDRARRLANLAVTLKVHAVRTQSDTDLDIAVSTARAAAEAIHPDHPDRVVALSNLGSALRERFARSGAPEDITAAIHAHSEALAAFGAGRPGQGGYLSNYANALLARAVHAGSAGDLSEAVTALDGAIASSPATEPYRAVHQCNLGNVLRARAELTGSEVDRRAAIEALSAATESVTAAPFVRVGAAAAMAELLTDPDPARHADVLATAVELLPRLADRYLTRGDQQHVLSGLSGLIADAAALTLMNTRLPGRRRAERALRLIETGRTVMLTQALDTRNDLSELRRKAPALALRFVELRDLLDEADTARTDLYERSQEFDTLLGQIRKVRGFASFAALASMRELRRDAAPGPIVTVNVSRHRSDALVLTETGVNVVPLPGLTVGALGEWLAAFHHALDDTAAPSYATRIHAEQQIGEVLGWLWDAVAAPVLATLEHIPGSWPRLWWAPGGILGLLPLHAAGRVSPDTVLDRVISSFTPTIRALRYARLRSRAIDPSGPESDRSLVVAMPVTPAAGARQLPHAREEAWEVADLLPNPVVLLGTDPAEDPAVPYPVTRDAVFEYLPDSSIAHFACHGATDTFDPSLSRLLLQDSEVKPLTVASLATIRLDKSRLAYLSACRTARQEGTDLLDEAIHLASAFQLAGFPHVIATLWQVIDHAAVEVAQSFYANLTADDIIDPDRAAVALHHTVMALRGGRQYGARLSAWAAYVHFGA